ncbi:hypothetical protein CLCR_08884 [Cladophialophora carrionii]|uniref:MACPF domain-containing protein n=1 Tax=Cladophialophora carrionii TaxID=86049 RepID=A0A1C1CS87_9EURO|nr:hypothetical protein CLCR_08884 [Cladophialophora carrionii]
MRLWSKVIRLSDRNISLEFYRRAERNGALIKESILRVRKTGDTKKDVLYNSDRMNHTHPHRGNTGDDAVAPPTPPFTPAPRAVPAPGLGFLPSNLFSGFGGFDASYAFGSLESFRPNVFDLSIWEMPLLLGSMLNFTWSTESTFFSASGSSKVEFIHELSEKVDIGFSFLGFKQYNREETFNKYVALYDQEIIYKVGFKDTKSAKQHLSADMKKALATWSADSLVDQFGTHYMTAAWLGRMRTDKLDTFSKTELIEALKTKIPLKGPEADHGFLHRFPSDL